MNKVKSLSTHIVRNIFAVVLILVAFVVIVCGVFLSTAYISWHQQATNTALQKKANALELLLEQEINSTDYIIKNSSLINGLNKQYTDGYELLTFINEFKNYMNAFSSNAADDTENILIYTSNPTLVEAKYLRKMSSLSKEMAEAVDTSDDNRFYYWWKDIRQDSSGRHYLSLLRKVPIEQTAIIEIKLFYDDILQGDGENEDCKIVPTNMWQHKENETAMPLFDSFVLTQKNSGSGMWGIYAIYFAIALPVVAAILLGVFFLLSRTVSRVTNDILNFVDNFENDVLQQPKSRWWELRAIEKKILSLNQQIYDMSCEKFESQLAVKNMEMEILNAKINPHLLYNSLSVIKLQAFESNNLEIEQTTDLLIEYYRLMLNKGKETISIGEELNYLEKYIRINEISKCTEYEFDVDISSDAYGMEIPHMLLQPIVENAVCHGLNNSRGRYIGFKVYLEKNDLIIEIADDGNGIEEERLSQLNNGEMLGYGLTNVVSRLDYYYGNCYRLDFYSKKDEGTRVVLRIMQ